MPNAFVGFCTRNCPPDRRSPLAAGRMFLEYRLLPQGVMAARARVKGTQSNCSPSPLAQRKMLLRYVR